MSATHIEEVDFIVIGGGIAGLSAAKELAHHGRVAVMMKGRLRESSTNYAQGGIAVALDQSDTPHFHYDDTLAAGDGICNSGAVKILVENGPKRVNELIQLGANFDRNGTDYHYTKEAAHSHRRILHAGDATGREIERTLGNHLKQNPNISFWPNTSVMQVLTDDSGCTGVLAQRNGEIVLVHGRAVMLASGGLGQLFSHNTNPTVATGDGIAMALLAGAQLQDMEFIQFHPTTLYTGDKKPISIFLISEAVRGEGAVLRNIHGERFMQRYDSRGELAPRDVVSRAITFEMLNTASDYVYLDLSAVDGDLSLRFPTIFLRCLESNIDIRRDFIPVSPAAHYMMGGVKTDLVGLTAVPGLYAVGEVACAGIHGANRLASNSLLDGLVFGHIAAEHAIAHAGGIRYSAQVIPATVEKKMSSAQRATVMNVRQQIRSMMWDKVGIVRHAAGLEAAVSELYKIAARLADPVGDPLWAEVRNMAGVGRIMAESALARTESRGAHFREDYPQKNDVEWLGHLVYSGTLNSGRFDYQSVEQVPANESHPKETIL